MCFAKVVLAISGESPEVTCSVSKTLEKSFWRSSLLIHLLFRCFSRFLPKFQDINLTAFEQLYFRTHFNGCFCRTVCFYLMVACLGIIFLILGWLRLPKSSVKNVARNSWGEIKLLTHHSAGWKGGGEVCSRLGPWNLTNISNIQVAMITYL